MLQYRKSLFETNSSSTHSIIIADNYLPSNLPTSIDFCIDEFGWARSCLNTIEEKAAYFYTAACAIYCRDVKEEIIDLLAPFNIECEFSVPPCFDHSSDWTWLRNGYLDHGDEAKPFVDYCLDNPYNLLSFVCSPESFVLTGNDNDDNDDGWFDIVDEIKYPHTAFFKGN